MASVRTIRRKKKNIFDTGGQSNPFGINFNTPQLTKPIAPTMSVTKGNNRFNMNAPVIQPMAPNYGKNSLYNNTFGKKTPFIQPLPTDKNGNDPNNPDNSGFVNAMNSKTADGILKGITALHTGILAKNNKINYLGLNQQNLKADTSRPGGAIVGAVGKTVNGVTEILDSIAEASKSKTTVAQKMGLYGRGGRMFAEGGLSTEDKISQGVSTATSLAGNAIQQAQLDEDPEDVKAQLQGKTLKGYTNGMTFDTIASQYNQLPQFGRVSASDYRKNSYFQDVVNGISAGNQGAQAGFNIGGGWGALVGGIIGTGSSIIGSLTGRSKAAKAARSTNALASTIEDTNARTLENDTRVASAEQKSTLAQGFTGVRGIASAFGGQLGDGLQIGDEIDITPEEYEALINSGVGMEVQSEIPKNLKEGDEVDLTQDQIAALLLAGYKLDFE